ncbi:hypothetical protein Nepgr_009272 [Nepenthes gracilis]|uniref:Uncharacterized protein n=1 Tax=Nepenthes gracilis TaxID=150966 RepID=A0AAD3SAE9_NEPGR|nr:hypothetical protein Nepgr_009272 [Nepenthes gracilis]
MKKQRVVLIAWSAYGLGSVFIRNTNEGEESQAGLWRALGSVRGKGSGPGSRGCVRQPEWRLAAWIGGDHGR